LDLVKGIIGRDVTVVIVASLEQRAMDERDDLLVFNISSFSSVFAVAVVVMVDVAALLREWDASSFVIVDGRWLEVWNEKKRGSHIWGQSLY
jgi:hypothetical protein